MKSFKKIYDENQSILIKNEFKRIKDKIYVDHVGATLYSETQIDNITKILKENLYCNPHTSKTTGDLIDQVRYRILADFNTDPTEYDVVFVANATVALKTVAETFNFKNGSNESGAFYYCEENHTSVLGMRELVDTEQHYVLTKNDLLSNLTTTSTNNPDIENDSVNSLVVFSAQCNFSGYKMPLDLIHRIHKSGLKTKGLLLQGFEAVRNENFFVFLDTASYVSTNYLDLGLYKPDFCCISFYKLFGFPTGVGALLVSKRGQKVLNKKYYGGGTVKIAMTSQNFHAKRDIFYERFEDGTLPFLSIVSLLEGYHTIERLIPRTATLRSMEKISHHVFHLAKYCYETLFALKHLNGNSLVKFYNYEGYKNVTKQGGIVTFNVMHDIGTYVGYAEIACIADVFNIHLRTGCFCNPGACQRFLALSNSDIKDHYKAGHICSDYNDLVNGLPTGAVRISFGYMSSLEDVEKFIAILKHCYLITAVDRLRLIEKKNLPQVLQNIQTRLKPRLLSIYIYPIKSCGAVNIKDSWLLERNGLKYDRCWMIVDSNNVVLTQKHCNHLCLIKPTLDITGGYLELNFPSAVPIKVSINNLNSETKTIPSSLCQSKVCSDLVQGIDCGDDVAVWLSKCLEIKGIRLIRQCSVRKNLKGQEKEISLVNQSQFLLINKTSVSWISNKGKSINEPLNVTIDRFRANFVIETPKPLEENNFDEITIGSITMKVDGFCTRCQMICINQHTGCKTAEPLQTIARELKGNIKFGIYLSLRKDNNLQHISCSDELTVKIK